MVPVNWALASADVNAGTARAARIAIIAITTSSSMRVNAKEGLFIFIFMDFFLFCGCSVGFCFRVALRVFVLRGFAFGVYSAGDPFWGFSKLKCGLSQAAHVKSRIILTFF